MSDIKITSVRAIETAPQRGCNLIVVRIDTNQPGLYGYGCATFTQRHKAVVTAIEEYMNQLLTGRDALDINDAWSVMMNSSYWRNGPVLNNAISGVDEALWDIKGKMAGMPVYELIGGKCREGVKIMPHGGRGKTLEETEPPFIAPEHRNGSRCGLLVQPVSFPQKGLCSSKPAWNHSSM